MAQKQNLNTEIIYKTVCKLIETASSNLPEDTYKKLGAQGDCEYREKILKNAFLAQKAKRPLCQDTGQVVIFLEIGQDVVLEGEYIEDVINKAVSDCYKDNFLRKSTVKDAIFDRTNTGDNTPAIIHTKIVPGADLNVLAALKGGGSENVTVLKMFNPTTEFEEIIEFVKECVKNAGENACPPMSVGIGAGGTAESAAILSKKALFFGKELDITISNVFETRILTAPTHIACLPVCVNLNCHSKRHAKAKISNGQVIFEDEYAQYPDISVSDVGRELKTDDIQGLLELKNNEKVLLTGTIYTARDAAHKRLAALIKEGKPLPIGLKNAIIFYAGPCPKTENEIIGPIGPTTSKRMDKFAPLLYENGVIATIGKGDRTIKGLNKLYFKADGGIACYLQNCIKKAELVGFEDLGAEAIYKLEIEKMPLKTIIL